MTSPYRTHVKAECARARRRSGQDAEVLAAAGLLWVTSVARVVGAVVQHETFGTEATLALFTVVGVLLLVVSRLRARRSPGGSGSPAGPLEGF